VKESNPSASLPLLAAPLRYVRVWDDHGTGCVRWHSILAH